MGELRGAGERCGGGEESSGKDEVGEGRGVAAASPVASLP